MRVALVAGGLPFGGSTTFALYLGSGLKKLGISAEVFSFTQSHPLAEEFQAAGISVHCQNEARLIFEDRLANIYQELRHFKPTVVIAVIGAEPYELMRYLPASVSRVSVVHDTRMTPEALIPSYRHLLGHVVVVADYLLEMIRRLALQVPVTHVTHGIPFPADIDPRDANTDAPLRLLYYGRLVQEPKRVNMLPEIARALDQRQVRFDWTIHGVGPAEAYLRDRFADDIAAGRVRFSTPVQGSELYRMIRKHDVYVLTSSEEGGPLTLLESMAMGLVPVCGDIPGLVREVISLKNGFRVRSNDIDAYADAISRIDADRQLLEQMSKSARETMTENFTDEAMARRYVEVFRSLAKEQQDGSWPESIVPMGMLGGNAFLSSSLAKCARRVAKRLSRD